MHADVNGLYSITGLTGNFQGQRRRGKSQRREKPVSKNVILFQAEWQLSFISSV